jgi:alpha-tubulin suppressor-like RCC1 family protein
LRADGQVNAWGRNYRANLGDGTTTLRTRPVLVRNVADAVSIGSGRDFGQAVLADGRLRMWGDNASGQLGDGTLTRRTTAILVPGVTGAVKAGGGGAAYAVVLVGSVVAP